MTILASNVTDNLGLNNNYNGGRLATAYNTNNAANLKIFSDVYGYDAATLFEVMRYHVEAYIMGGGLKTYTDTSILIDGYEDDIASRINGGEYYGGYDFSLTNATTPVFNDNYGGVAEANYGLYTGSHGLDEIGEIRLINGEAYVNKITRVWNGTYFTDVPQNPDGTTGMKHAVWLDGVGNGMQLPPFVDTDSKLEIFDTKLIAKTTFTHADDSTIDGSDVTISKFSTNTFGGDVGFAYNQDF